MDPVAIGLPGPTESIIIGIMLLVIYVIPSGVIAFVAWNYGRSPAAWFFISIVATPLLSLIALVALGRMESE